MQRVKCIIRSFVLLPSAIILGAFLQWKLCVWLWVMFKWLVLSRSFFHLPSASSILGMSRNFSATSKAVFRLPMGSSYKETQFTVGLHWVWHKSLREESKQPCWLATMRRRPGFVNLTPDLIIFVSFHCSRSRTRVRVQMDDVHTLIFNQCKRKK